MDDTDLKELLQERAEGVRMDPNPRLPRPMLRRGRRRRALTGAVAGLTAAVVVAGAVVGIQAAFHEKAQPKPAHHGPSPAPSGGSSSAVRFPGIWPVANRPELASLFRDRAGIVHFKSVLTSTEAALAFASHVLQWAPSRTVVHGSRVAGGHARVTLWNEDMGRFSPQIGLNVDLQRFSQGAREVWVVTRAQSGLMDVRCPSPRQDVLLPGAPINVCGRLSQPPSGWTMDATVEYAASELQPSEAQNGTNPVIAGRAFKGTIVLTATYADADVTLAIRLFSGSGATLGIDVRRLQIGSSPTGTGGAGLPAEVERTRLAILRAVRAGNYSKLQPLIPPKGFTFTTGRQSN